MLYNIWADIYRMVVKDIFTSSCNCHQKIGPISFLIGAAVLQLKIHDESTQGQ